MPGWGEVQGSCLPSGAVARTPEVKIIRWQVKHISWAVLEIWGVLASGLWVGGLFVWY